MKRLSAIVLALIMTLSMSVAVFADDNVLTDGENLVAGETYTYVATQDGTLYYAITYYDYDYGYGFTYENNVDYIAEDIESGYFWMKVDGVEPEDGYFGSVEVTEGQSLTFELFYDGTLDATLDLNYTGISAAIPGCDAEHPIEIILRQCPLVGEIISAGSSLYYGFSGFSGSIITISGGVTVQRSDYDGEGNEVLVDIPANADGVTEVEASYYTVLRITNSAASDATIGVDYYYATGSFQNPEAIPVDSNETASLSAGQFHYFKWTAYANGSLTVNVSGTNGWMYSVDVGSDSGSFHYSDDDPVVACETVDVNEDDVVIIYVSTYDAIEFPYPASDITVVLSFTEGGEDSSSEEESSEVVEDTLINYENNETPVAAEDIAADITEWEWVDVLDGVKDIAVKGEDGLYHLNSADGPVLFLDFKNNEFFDDIETINGTGGMKYTVLNDDGSKERGQYKLLVNTYLEASESGLVALNDELIDMMQKVGSGQGWYTWNAEWTFMLEEGETVDADEAWLFLCKYNEGFTSGPVEDEPDTPVTGASDNVLLFVILMLGVAVALPVTVKAKKN